ncbi:MAG: prepilin-type N-terminal cleavage/methylation domain-containing protein [Candidatus Marinimicrobia bacterium]|nr:prepilin-type N-terminal cleavage/methylation domain-containing protein [Candidatus Neomarinimicrobiota bacterium]MBL7022876.1 prepilin-type N-terminal cleavage/methylation domain-containing protein [Candidatus Neomarinimicrobiota bacterium]MBL7109195.1 prepilin-type N-terminal cleavage/methylation domain-containing protein [Candidatus Neomarinimicrobiota bacterium]
MMNILNKQFKGMTLVEGLIAIAISSTVMLGMGYIFSEVSRNFEQEFNRERIIHYGNVALDEITEQLKYTNDITLSTEDNFRRITLKKNDTNVIISANNNEGILIDDKPILRFSFEQEKENSMTLLDFWCDHISPGVGNHSSGFMELIQSIFKIEISIQNNEDGRIYNFKKEVFTPRFYISNKL